MYIDCVFFLTIINSIHSRSYEKSGEKIISEKLNKPEFSSTLSSLEDELEVCQQPGSAKVTTV